MPSSPRRRFFLTKMIHHEWHERSRKMPEELQTEPVNEVTDDNRDLYIQAVVWRLKKCPAKEVKILDTLLEKRLPSQLTVVKKEGGSSEYEKNPTATHRAMVDLYQSHHKQHGKQPDMKAEDVREAFKGLGLGYPVITKSAARDIKCIDRAVSQRGDYWDKDVDGTIIYRKIPGKPKLVA
jgi:hypothetical protein